ncbi:synaptic vesicle glycoprotein 2C-like isoform X1 [Colias croceus]|uniref:synaptic vesicle glycoprotein 2C-like isoform X1 n=1 Tax=Colias crocea TaxID=72248 RepID=UPI001E280750|nr:synaptic vesicle glycoprotein 2C-like isoform X1 [Colias croceus]
MTMVEQHLTVTRTLRPVLSGLDFLEHGADFEAAISATGFGRFHFCLLAITGLIYADTAIGITIVSFVLPAATCDFRMTSADKGWLTAAPMLGMVIGSYFWGCLADTKGRKIVLVSTLLLDGFIGIVSSFVQILPVFMACRFVNGFAVAGAMGICFPYLGEFQATKYREKILCWMEMFWTLGVILLPLIAWAIIPIQGIRMESGSFSYDSWNWFVAACGIPSLMLGFWLMTFPESPKFMMECGDYDDALACLKSVYKQNTGDDPDNYPIKSLKEKQRTISVASQNSQKSVRSLSMRKRKDLKRLFSEIWTQTKALCRPPYLKYTILTCLIQFGLTTSYYTLMIWFPELFNRYEEFEHRFPNTSASVCDVSGVVVDDDSMDPYDCEKIIDQSVYMHTLIVGLACIPTSLWLPLCVHKLGAKFFLIFSLGFAGLVTVGLFFVQNSTQNLVLSCIFEALTSLAISLVFCVLVDLFPTNLRVMAAALSLTAGRGGGLIGNLSFGYLIDINCVIPIVVFAAFLFIAAILCFLLPKTGQEALD